MARCMAFRVATIVPASKGSALVAIVGHPVRVQLFEETHALFARGARAALPTPARSARCVAHELSSSSRWIIGVEDEGFVGHAENLLDLADRLGAERGAVRLAWCPSSRARESRCASAR